MAKHTSGREPTFILGLAVQASARFARESKPIHHQPMSVDLERVKAIAGRVAASGGLELVEVEMRGGGKARMLRIVIDKPGGVTHEDCAHLSREVSTIIDVEDAVPGGSYTLEVSSPGLERALRGQADFEHFSGSRVKLMTREPVNNNRHFEGRLEGVAGGRLVLELAAVGRKRQKKMGGAGERVEIELANVERANLAPEI